MREAIGLELYEAARKLGAKSDLLGLIDSFGEATITDEEVLRGLRGWNVWRTTDDGEGEASRLEDAIKGEIHAALKWLGASPELLDAVGSWGDTTTEAQVLDHLRRLNAVN